MLNTHTRLDSHGEWTQNLYCLKSSTRLSKHVIFKFSCNKCYYYYYLICLLSSGNLGEVLIRCNNVLYVRGAEEEDEEGEMKE